MREQVSLCPDGFQETKRRTVYLARDTSSLKVSLHFVVKRGFMAKDRGTFNHRTKDLAWQLHETHLINVFLIPFVQCTCMWAERKSSDEPLLVLSLPEQLSL